jgi:poly-beta-1,6-N-acetyl-D-glucosamine synthase
VRTVRGVGGWVNAVTTRGGNSTLSRDKPSGIATRAGGDRRDGDWAGSPSWPEWYQEPDPGRAPQADLSQAASEAEAASLGRHRRSAPGADVFRTRSGVARDKFATVPLPRLAGGLARRRATGETELGLRALLSLSTAVQDAPAPAAAPRRRQPMADSSRKRSAAMAPATPVATRPKKVLAIVPAHNEAASIAETIHSLRRQTWAPDEILVVVNNSTDDTAQISRDLDVCVYDVGQITGRKAGALNLALDRYLPLLDDDDLVLSMDADTVLTENLIENAGRHFIADPQLGALSSNHLVMRHGNLLELLQAMEYERDRVMIGRRKGRGGCMTGMAAVFRVAALREIKNTYGQVYDSTNWTEDWKLTIALRHTHWRMLRPQDCLVSTVPVTRVPALIHQRERWARGYLQTLMQFGLTRTTVIPWLKQLGFAFSISIRLLFFTMLGLLIANHDPLVAWWMIPVVAIFAADAAWTVRGTGKWGMLVASVLIIEVVYAWILTAAIARGYFKQLIDYRADNHNTWVKVREGS